MLTGNNGNNNLNNDNNNNDKNDNNKNKNNNNTWIFIFSIVCSKSKKEKIWFSAIVYFCIKNSVNKTLKIT